jgi:hypothetical protein
MSRRNRPAQRAWGTDLPPRRGDFRASPGQSSAWKMSKLRNPAPPGPVRGVSKFLRAASPRTGPSEGGRRLAWAGIDRPFGAPVAHYRRRAAESRKARNSVLQNNKFLFFWQTFCACCRAERRSAYGQRRWPLHCGTGVPPVTDTARMAVPRSGCGSAALCATCSIGRRAAHLGPGCYRTTCNEVQSPLRLPLGLKVGSSLMTY